jgi:hypothetical protein
MKPNNHISKATNTTTNYLSVIIFSILPNNKKNCKNKSYILIPKIQVLSRPTTNYISGKVFSILSKTKKKFSNKNSRLIPNIQVTSKLTTKQNSTQKLYPHTPNNKNIYKNATPKPHSQPTIPTKSINLI